MPRAGNSLLSVCIIALNEELRLPRCLESLSFADEIVVLDGGSVDGTIKLAKSYPRVRVEKRRFDDFVRQKNHVISLAKYPWILVVDADEVVTPALRDEISQVIGNNISAEGYRVPRMTFYLGKWIKHCGWFPDYNIRLFRRGRARFEGGTVHEKVAVDGTIGTLKGHLQHHSYRTTSDHLIRMDQYSTLLAEDKFLKGKRSGPLLAGYKSLSKFLLIYFWKLGFLDGRPGFVIAVMGAYYNFLKYIKLWELRRGLRKPGDRVRYPGNV